MRTFAKSLGALGTTGILALAPVAVATPASAAQQNGLVNVAVEDVVLQVPVGVAANVCPNLNLAAVLAAARADQTTTCNATVEQFPIAFQQPV